MNSNDISEMIRASMDGISELANVESAIGRPILTPSGTTIIPISRVAFGFANGGLDLGAKKLSSAPSFSCLGGTGGAVTPLGFLVVNADSTVQLVPLGEGASTIDRAIELIEKAPEMIKKLRDDLT